MVELNLPEGNSPYQTYRKTDANKLGAAYILAISTIALLAIGSFLSFENSGRRAEEEHGSGERRRSAATYKPDYSLGLSKTGVTGSPPK